MTDEERNFRHREFWLWEFVRRNVGYRRDYDAFVQIWEQFTPIKNYRRGDIFATLVTLQGLANLDLVEPTKRDKIHAHFPSITTAISGFAEKYGRSPKDYTEGHEAEEILVALLAGDESILDNYTDYEQRPVATEHEELGSGKVQLVIDLGRNLDMILKEVTAIYYDCKYQDPEAKLRREIGQAREECVRQAIKEQGGRLRAANLPRACGLCIYDQQVANPGESLHAITKQFLDKFEAQLGLIPGQRSLFDVKRLSDLYKVIQSSVDQIQFKPLT
ncbi:MAG: hypothetical protein HY795_17300 [Desulfovibrio sp.]|nr:hypothetical protein [Desulfovibrio sp.]